jgi:hypothetical protein
MAKLNEFVKDFVPQTTKNISELDVVNIDAEIFHDGKGTNDDGEEYTYSYLIVNKERYRITSGVIKQLKDIIAENPNLNKFKVKKSGEGKTGTKYQVIPIM